jgi:hypothetical protein
MPENQDQLTLKSFSIEPKLENQTSYSKWAFQMKLLFMAAGLWNSATSAPTASALSFHAISQNVTESVRDLLIDCNDAAAAWNLLSSKWAGTSIPLQIQMLQALCSFSFSSSDPQADFNKLKDLRRTLQASCGPSSTSIKIDDLVALIALSALPEQYAPLRAVLENSITNNQDILNIATIEEKVLTEFSKVKILNSDTASHALQT